MNIVFSRQFSHLVNSFIEKVDIVIVERRSDVPKRCEIWNIQHCKFVLIYS